MKEVAMQSIQTQELELFAFQGSDDPTREARATWPVYRDTGSANTAVVYFELEPGAHLGSHTDSAEEVLVVLAGEVEATVGGEQGRLSAGGIAVVPAMVPHDVRSVGKVTAKVAGVFSSNTIVSIFDDAWEPIGTRIVTTPPAVEAGAEAAVAH